MVSALALIATLLGTAATWPAEPRDSVGDGARLVVREARVAVEHDSAQAIMARWSSQLGRDSCDRRMLLGLATAARLSYDDTTATRLYQRLLDSPSSGDTYSVYAQLGLARILLDRADLRAADSAAGAGLLQARALHDRIAEGEALLAVADAAMDEDANVGRAYLDSALRALPATATEATAEAQCRRVRLGFRSGDARFIRELPVALAYARRVGATRAEAQCLRTAAINLWTSGQLDSASVLMRRSAQLQRTVRDRRSLAFTLATLADLLRDQGAYGEARATVAAALEQARVSRYVWGEALATHLTGTLAYSLHDSPPRLGPRTERTPCTARCTIRPTR
jgi:hypothetical protein